MGFRSNRRSGAFTHCLSLKRFPTRRLPLDPLSLYQFTFISLILSRRCSVALCSSQTPVATPHHAEESHEAQPETQRRLA